MRWAPAVLLFVNALTVPAHADETGAELDLPPEMQVPEGGQEILFGIALGPSLLRTPETRASAALLMLRLEVSWVGRRLGIGFVPFRGHLGVAGGWRAGSAGGGGRLRLTRLGRSRQVVLSYDVTYLEIGERVHDELECGELFPCVLESEAFWTHTLAVTWTGRGGRRNPALGMVAEASAKVRERLWWVQLSFTLTLGLRQVPPRPAVYPGRTFHHRSVRRARSSASGADHFGAAR